MTSLEKLSCHLVGGESLLIQCAEILMERGWIVRGIASADPAVRAWSEKRSIPTLNIKDGWLEALGAEPFDYLFSIANLSMIPAAELGLARRGGINFHDGPLPHYAGLNAPVWSLLGGESEHAINWHRIVDKADQGDVLIEEKFPIVEGDTALTLNAKCYEAALATFPRLIDGLADGSLKGRPQDLSAYRHFGRNDRPAAACFIDWTDRAERIDALVRALHFGSYRNLIGLPKLNAGGRLYNVLSTELADGEAESGGSPGAIVRADAEGVEVETGRGRLILRKVGHVCGAPTTLEKFIARCELKPGAVFNEPDKETADRLTRLNSELCRHESVWVQRLAKLAPVEIPYANRSGASERADGVARIEPRLPEALVEAAARLNGSGDPGDFLAAAFAAYLARLTGGSAFDLGLRRVAIERRLEGDLGLFSRTVPVRARVAADASFKTFYLEFKKELDLARQRKSFARDVSARHPELARLARDGEGIALPVGLTFCERIEEARPSGGSELTLAIAEGGRRAALLYDGAVIDAASAAAIAHQFEVFLGALIAGGTLAPIARLPLMTEEERRRALDEWNATAADYPAEACVHRLFEAQVERAPDATAVVFKSESLTYRQLNERANRLAHHLIEMGVGPDAPVGVCVDRSIEMMVAILAVQKAGGAYVPLDPAYPHDRLVFMLEDSGAGALVTQTRHAGRFEGAGAKVVRLDADAEAIAARPADNPASAVTSAHLAYVIYTSGSTGKPKGVMVEHRNVANFFTGMDAVIDADGADGKNGAGVWLAVTSLSFDISVLELFWTLARGFKVVLYAEERIKAAAPRGAAPSAASARKIDFSLFYFASDEGEKASDKYQLLLDGARFADKNGFSAVWTPERHFHAFGGLYPNPAVASAALATITERVRIRAGSVVNPLHHPIRVAEDWALVDNLSRGRVEISFASGWMPNDFVLRPENYADRKNVMLRDIETIRKLWRGEEVAFPGPLGKDVPIRTLPRPIQPELPFWLTAAGNPETFRAAGAAGAGVLTHLLGQTVEELTEKINVYREARREAGHEGPGRVALMLHAFIGDNDADVRAKVRQPLKDYLKSSTNLLKQYAWSFPVFKNATADMEDAFKNLTDEDMDALMEHAFERYYETSGLLGTPEACVAMVERIKEVGVDEIACMIDFGVDSASVFAQLPYLNELRKLASGETGAESEDASIGSLIRRHEVTHLQCTPSMAGMLVATPEDREGLALLKHLMVGGEAMPAELARALTASGAPRVTNMYGPTETTIWSSTHHLNGADGPTPIGRPIANTELYILSENLEPAPIGAPGELFIGGAGVVRGYLNRPELTAERFVASPFAAKGRLYRTGDLARHRPNGEIEFLGRIDHQVKIRGFRIELGEIESRLTEHASVAQAVVIAREDVPGDKRLVAYLIPAAGQTISASELRSHLKAKLPEFMTPAHFVAMKALPQTPNKKIDRKALPAPDRAPTEREAAYVKPESDLEGTIAAIWQRVLNVDRVGMQDNFFDLGGNSLLTVQVFNQLREAVGRQMSMTDMFRFPTVSTLAKHLGRDDGDATAAKGADRGDRRREAMLRRRRRPMQPKTETRV